MGKDAVQACFFASAKPAEELYDLKADRYELNNLAESPEHGDTLKRMRSIPGKWIKQTNDKGQYPESKESYEAGLKV